MSDNGITIYGKHGTYIRALTESIENFKLFNAAYIPYGISSVVGYLYGRKSEPDKSSPKGDLQIFSDQVKRIQDDLRFNYKLIMLLDKKYEPDFKERIKNAFYEHDKKNEDLFNSYTLGGIEILYEKLIGNAKDVDDYIENMNEFIQDFNAEFNKDIKEESIIEFCRKLQMKNNESSSI